LEEAAVSIFCCEDKSRHIILPLALHGFETWSLTLREEHRLRVFEKRVLRRIFGPKREEEIGVWRKMRDELHNLYSLQNIIRMTKSRMRSVGHIACMTDKRNAYKVLVGKPEGKRPLGRLGIAGRIILR
jgi:hypothetical protein